MNRNDLCDLILQAKTLIDTLTKAWLNLEDKDIEQATEQQQLICDSCEEKED